MNNENSLIDGVLIISIFAISLSVLIFIFDNQTQNLKGEFSRANASIDRFVSKYDDTKIFLYLSLLPFQGETKRLLENDSTNIWRQARMFDLRLAGFDAETQEELDKEIDKVGSLNEFLATTTQRNLNNYIWYINVLGYLINGLSPWRRFLFLSLTIAQLINIVFATRLSCISLRKKGN